MRSLRIRALLLVLVLALVGVGCESGSDGGEEEPSPADTETGTGTEAAGDGEVTAAGQTVTIVDDVGRVVELETPIESVIAYNNYNLEFVRAVGAVDKVVAVPDGTGDTPNFWPSLDLSVTAGDQTEPNWEQVVDLQPDVVILPRNGAWQEAVDQLEDFGTKVVVLTGWDVLAHEKNISQLGVMFQQRDRAEEINEFYGELRTMLEERLADVPPRKVYWEASSELETVIPGSGWHDMLEIAGAINIFEDIDIPTAESAAGAASGSVHSFPIEAEQVVEREPVMVVKRAGGGYAGTPPDELQTLMQEFVDRPLWEDIPAVQDGRVHTITRFAAGSSSKIIGAVYVAKWLYPEVFEDVDPDAIMTEWLEEFQGVEYDPSVHRATLEAGGEG